MRLKKVTLSGFKSFVDTTKIIFPTDFTAVVGPNGCGKSNLIDAVRWVLGEGSAKNLRGDSMTDVIFSGSSERKPVSHTSVELLFDNDRGLIGGSYSKFGEIALRRSLVKDGVSSYYINNTRARRKDITDLFRGTGLGSRSYSIIEQGMVSKIVESKPEELRYFVEEVAGITKYKDRKHETETRIRHTRENLVRLQDLSQEHEKRLNQLAKQASDAKKYKKLIEQKRCLEGQELLLNINALQCELDAHNKELKNLELAYQMAVSEKNSCEASSEQYRIELKDLQLGAEGLVQINHQNTLQISKLESEKARMEDFKIQKKTEQERLLTDQSERSSQIESIKNNKLKLAAIAKELEVDLLESQNKVEVATNQVNIRVKASEELTEKIDSESRRIYNQQAKKKNEQDNISRLVAMKAGLCAQEEKMILNEADLLSQISKIDLMKADFDLNITKKELSDAQNNYDLVAIDYDKTAQKIVSFEQESRQLEADLKLVKDKIQWRLSEQKKNDSRVVSKDYIKKKIFGNDVANSIFKISDILEIEPGWHDAVDAALGDKILGYMMSDDMEADNISNINKTVFLVSSEKVASGDFDQDDRMSLKNKVTCNYEGINNLLRFFIISKSMSDAFEGRAMLRPHECFILRDGTCVGSNWVMLRSDSSINSGVLASGFEIQELESQQKKMTESLGANENNVKATREQLKAKEQEKQQAHQHYTLCTKAEIVAHQHTMQLRDKHKDLTTRLQNCRNEKTAHMQKIQSIKLELQVLEDASNRGEKDAIDGSELEAMQKKRQELMQAIQRDQLSLTAARDDHHRLSLKQRSYSEELKAMANQHSQYQLDLETIHNKLEKLNVFEPEQDEKISQLKAQIEAILQEKERQEYDIKQYKIKIDEVEETLQSYAKNYRECNIQAQDLREKRDAKKNKCHAIHVEHGLFLERFKNENYTPELAEELQKKTDDIDSIKKKKEKISHRVDNYGAVNLVAIEEHKIELERQQLLEHQYNDLCQSLEKLEAVIRTIDKESRARFRKAFADLNNQFEQFFPQLFGGGKASLSLTVDDPLLSGIIVHACPPGKKNSRIQMLSGGEKALTAIALLFSLFKLNPSPFCMLDEVDAPLDEVNVERYCQTLRSLSSLSQIVVITHNKVTMKNADCLIGVTMSEPGISRVVGVDLDSAMTMLELST